MDTGEKLLVEASAYDTLWDIGLRMDDPEIMAKKRFWGRNIQPDKIQ